jgi:hypothetical protein
MGLRSELQCNEAEAWVAEKSICLRRNTGSAVKYTTSTTIQASLYFHSSIMVVCIDGCLVQCVKNLELVATNLLSIFIAQSWLSALMVV